MIAVTAIFTATFLIAVATVTATEKKSQFTISNMVYGPYGTHDWANLGLGGLGQCPIGKMLSIYLNREEAVIKK